MFRLVLLLLILLVINCSTIEGFTCEQQGNLHVCELSTLDDTQDFLIINHLIGLDDSDDIYIYYTNDDDTEVFQCNRSQCDDIYTHTGITVDNDNNYSSMITFKIDPSNIYVNTPGITGYVDYIANDPEATPILRKRLIELLEEKNISQFEKYDIS